jgi:hypothetical protein
MLGPVCAYLSVESMDSKLWNFKFGSILDMCKEQYRVTIRNKFAVLENLENSGDINRA